MNPKLLLAEEPTANLHSSQGGECMDLFNRLNAEGTTVVQGAPSEKNPAYGNRVIQLRDGWIINN
jgi:ABC-type ATPase involved in cell division